MPETSRGHRDAGGIAEGLPETTAAPSSPQRTLGEYDLLEQIGEGGMGVVYKAHHAHLKRTVALKMLPKALTANDREASRFRREMAAIGRLHHTHIVQAYDAREIDGVSVLIMEYVEGMNLSKLADCAGWLSIADACELIRQAGLGLQYIEQHGLVHRDIKPSNLMLTCDGQVKILDLGLALFGADQSGEHQDADAGPVGTAEYIAPEQVLHSQSVDIRADLYSLGCTLYRLLAGRPPFGRPEYSSSSEKMTAHAFRPAPPVGQVRADVPDTLAGVLDRLLAKDPCDRFATAAAVVEALAPFTVGCDLPRLMARVSQRMDGATRPSDDPMASQTRRSSAVQCDTPTGTPPSPSAPFSWRKRLVILAVCVLCASAGAWAAVTVYRQIQDRQTLEAASALAGSLLPPVQPRPDENAAAMPGIEPAEVRRRFALAARLHLNRSNQAQRSGLLAGPRDVDIYRVGSKVGGVIRITVVPQPDLSTTLTLYEVRHNDRGDEQVERVATSSSSRPGGACSASYEFRAGVSCGLIVQAKHGSGQGNYRIEIEPAGLSPVP